MIMSPTSTTRCSSGMPAVRFWISETSSRKSGDSGSGRKSWGCQFLLVSLRRSMSCGGGKREKGGKTKSKNRWRWLRASASCEGRGCILEDGGGRGGDRGTRSPRTRWRARFDVPNEFEREQRRARAVSRAWKARARGARERRLEARQDTSPGGEKTNTTGRRGMNPARRARSAAGACAHLVLSEVLHVHDDLAALGGEAGHLALGVALHDDHGGVHSRGLGGPELGGASGLGAGRLALVGARRTRTRRSWRRRRKPSSLRLRGEASGETGRVRVDMRRARGDAHER